MRPPGAAQAVTPRVIEDFRMQAPAVFLALVFPLALHGGALRVEVVEAAEAAAGRAHLTGELHLVGIARPVDGAAAGDAAAYLLGRRAHARAIIERDARLPGRALAVALGRAVHARGLTDAAAPGSR